MTFIVVVISFSVIVSCIFISLLLVTVGIMYTRADNSVNAIISILFDGENISFDASLVMYINSTSFPPIMIINRIFGHQNLLYIVPLIKHSIVVWISSISPMARGCFICVNISLVNVLNDMSNFVISRGILFKMLVLGINEMVFCLSSEVLKGYSLFLISRTLLNFKEMF
jgi:archaellum component FlaF (FlaF/FlaG flagellin family)